MIRPRKRFAPITAREWLDTLHRANGPESDWAVELLAVLDQVEDPSYDEELFLTDVAERAGDATLETMDELVRMVDTHHRVERLAGHEMVKDLIEDTPYDRIEQALDDAAKRQAQLFALSELCMAAGVIAKDDYKTDPLPLLAMFLPVE